MTCSRETGVHAERMLRNEISLSVRPKTFKMLVRSILIKTLSRTVQASPFSGTAKLLNMRWTCSVNIYVCIEMLSSLRSVRSVYKMRLRFPARISNYEKVLTVQKERGRNKMVT